MTIFARCVYRCVELSGGFNGTLFVSDEALFMVMEGAMIVSATTCLTFLHPAVAFQGAWPEAIFHFREKMYARQDVKMQRLGTGTGTGTGMEGDEESGQAILPGLRS